MTDFFFYGTLCHQPLLRQVLGRDVVATPAVLADHRVVWAAGQAFAVIMPDRGATAQGILVRAMTPDDVARLDFYAAGFGCDARDLAVLAPAATMARVYVPAPDQWVAGDDWHMADWVAIWGDTVAATAQDVMALYGQHPASQVRARYPLMLVRGGSTVRAAQGGPATLRFAAAAGDVVVARRTMPYARFFAVEEYDLQFRRFDGDLSAPINRAVFVSGDAVTVLPYDPVRDRVLLIEQFRVGPLARGDTQPWLLEAIAGRIDGGETPEQAARREAVEEAGLALGPMEYVGGYYPSPGAKAEYLYSYIALTDLPDDTAGVFGLASETENIRGHLVGFDALMALVAQGEINNAPLLLSVLWLQRERARLRGA
jgi:ADP-ribose pyrophosphatase